MKKTLIIFLIILIAFPCAGCGKDTAEVLNAEIFYVIQIEPDPSKTADELKAIIYLSNAEGMNASIEGKWHRLSGYP